MKLQQEYKSRVKQLEKEYKSKKEQLIRSRQKEAAKELKGSLMSEVTKLGEQYRRKLQDMVASEKVSTTWNTITCTNYVNYI